MGSESHYTSSNLGGIKRGDGADTGDLEAAPTESSDRTGSGKRKTTVAHVTGDASALGRKRGMTPLEPDNVLDDLTVKDVTDASLGLTNTPEKPAEDQDADSGPTRSEESEAPSRRR